jgi:protein phosphatase
VLGDVDAGSDVDVSVREAAVGDRWLLCSDALSNVVSEDTLAETLRDVEDTSACAEQLLDLALRAGAPDNVTCVVADVVEVATTPPFNPQVVGAAAKDRDRPSTAAATPAAKAAALTAGSEPGDDDVEDPDAVDRPGPGRLLRRVLAVLLVTGLLVGGGYAAYAWSQQQFYVGAADTDVAIYRGLTQDVGPVSLSSVYETRDLPIDTLPSVWQDRVVAGITASDLPEARRIVRDLLRRSDLCQPVPASTTPSPTTSAPPPSPSPSPTAPAAAPAPSPSPSPTSRFTPIPPSPSPTPALPDGCEETG